MVQQNKEENKERRGNEPRKHRIQYRNVRMIGRIPRGLESNQSRLEQNKDSGRKVYKKEKKEMLQTSEPIKGRFSCLLETVSSVNNTQTKNKEPLKLFNLKLQGKNKIDHTAQDNSDICI